MSARGWPLAADAREYEEVGPGFSFAEDDSGAACGGDVPPDVDPLPVYVFTTADFYQDEALWSDPRYYRCNSPVGIEAQSAAVGTRPINALLGQSITYRLARTEGGQVRYTLKTPYRNGTTHVMLLRASCPPPFGLAFGCSKSLPAILSSPRILSRAWLRWCRSRAPTCSAITACSRRRGRSELGSCRRPAAATATPSEDLQLLPAIGAGR